MLLPCSCWEVLSTSAKCWPLCATADKACLPCSLAVRGSHSTSAWHAAACAAVQASFLALCAPAGRTPCLCQTPSLALCRRLAPISGMNTNILALLYLVKRVMGSKVSWQAMGLPLHLCDMR